MTLDEPLLTRLADWRPAGPGPHGFRSGLARPGWSLTATADQADALSCRLAELTVDGPAPGAACTAAALTQQADRLARRVTGLLEPLRLIEVDAARAEALLRSEKPAVRGDELYYYELLLRGEHSSTLRRYKATRAGGRREAVPYALTHEAIAKLAADLADEE